VNEESIVSLIDELLATHQNFERHGYKPGADNSKCMMTGHEIFQGTINLMARIYGPDSAQVENLHKQASAFNAKYAGPTTAQYIGLIGMRSLVCRDIRSWRKCTQC
jgi:hypothetical protein